jgi:hypothetical protein
MQVPVNMPLKIKPRAGFVDGFGADAGTFRPKPLVIGEPPAGLAQATRWTALGLAAIGLAVAGLLRRRRR